MSVQFPKLDVNMPYEERIMRHNNTAAAHGSRSRSNGARMIVTSKMSHASSLPVATARYVNTDAQGQANTSSRSRVTTNNSMPSNLRPSTRAKAATIMPKPSGKVWKSAVDPKTGKTYYYDVVTRETQWRKPLELASEEERRSMERKEMKQKDFFTAMEQNILRNMQQGSFTPIPKADDEARDCLGNLEIVVDANVHSSSGAKAAIPRPKMTVRTISQMDHTEVMDLTRVASDKVKGKENSQAVELTQMCIVKSSESPTNVADLPTDGDPSWFCDDAPMDSEEEKERGIEDLEKTMKTMAQMQLSPAGSLDSSDAIAPLNTSDDATITSHESTSLAKPMLRKRNTCGTLYVSSTMSAPDKDATIRCIAGVFRAHLLQSVRDEQYIQNKTKFDEYEIFNDVNTSGNRPNKENLTVPSLDEITNFYRDVFRKAQMENDCIIMSLIYVERLVKDTNGGVRPNPANWRSILFSSMILSSKVWDDLSMWNADFSQCVSAREAGISFTVERINELERAMLECLSYSVKVAASEYAKYYFLLRSMLIRSGLGGDDVNALSPLDVEGAKQLELRSSKLTIAASSRINGESSSPIAKPSNRRVKSVGHDLLVENPFLPTSTKEHGSPTSTHASLEQIIPM